MDAPQYSCYLAHQNSAPGYHFGRLLPNPAADPYATYGSFANYSHLTRATRFTQVWLESNHYPYDVISDLDLHTTPGILQNYETVILPGHSEYWSIPAYNGLKSYLSNGGSVIALSGNTMYWRVSFSPDGTVMECRKADGVGEQVDARRRGEIWHSDDGLRGASLEIRVRDHQDDRTYFPTSLSALRYSGELLGSFFAFSILFSNADAPYVARKPPY